MLVMLSVILDMFLPTLSTENSKSVLDYSCMNNVMPDISYFYWVITYTSFTVGYVTLRETLGINALSPEQDGHLYEQYIFVSIFLNNELKIFK